MQVTVVGGGLAGSECALQLASRGVEVVLYEQRPTASSPAHHSDKFAELVCSNSLKSLKQSTAAGLLKAELQKMHSFLLQFAFEAQVPAGGALAVDRDKFSKLVTNALEEQSLIEIKHQQVSAIPDGHVVIAAGPLCSDDLFSAVMDKVGTERCSFFDAAAPIVDASTIDHEKVFRQSRWDEDSIGDYLNCPFNKEEYEAFVVELLAAEKVIAKDFEQKDLFMACQPVEEIARTGVDSLRFGPLKPVGLINPKTGYRPWANVQLRSENEYNTAYNLVGFQTNLTWPEQKRVFRMIPGLENAEFFRYGVMHRNSFIDSPHVLDRSFAIPNSTIRFAGQITGTEGYSEAIASGLLAALNTYCDLYSLDRISLPIETAFGSLVNYATSPETIDYQPMHVNFGIFKPLDDMSVRKRARYEKYAQRSLDCLEAYIASRKDIFAAKVSK